MPFYHPTYHSGIYRNFKEIERTAHRRIIRYYEDHETQIQQLDFDEYFELLIAYVDSLYEVGKYQKHLLMADPVIEASIRYNIQLFKGVDIYQSMLLKKASSLYHTDQSDEADYILRELIKINPENEAPIRLLKKCLKNQTPYFVKQSRAIGIVLILLTTMLFGIEVLIIEPFYERHLSLFKVSRFSIMGFAFLILIGSKLLHRWKVEEEVDGFVQCINTRSV